MYYRRKIILSILDLFDAPVEKIKFQKLLFLVCSKQVKPVFDFVPYKLGCFSFSANTDLVTMAKYSLIKEGANTIEKTTKDSFINQIRSEDIKIINSVFHEFKNLSAKELMLHTYRTHPFFAINSEYLNILSATERLTVQKTKNLDGNSMLFTIGYEGINVEQYFQKLIKNNIHLLIDVRKNPLSMKYGFNKNQLIKICNGLGIEYMHFPDLGIQSEMRKNLTTQQEYDNLFSYYKNNELKTTVNLQKDIVALIAKFNRIALTCFEANICQCHRKSLSESILSLQNHDKKFELQHI